MCVLETFLFLSGVCVLCMCAKEEVCRQCVCPRLMYSKNAEKHVLFSLDVLLKPIKNKRFVQMHPFPIWCLLSIHKHTIIATFEEGTNDTFWRLNGADMYGNIVTSKDPSLHFTEGDVVVFRFDTSNGTRDFSIADWSGLIEAFSPICGKRKRSKLTFELGPVLHYFCNSCDGSPFGDIFVHPRVKDNVCRNVPLVDLMSCS